MKKMAIMAAMSAVLAATGVGYWKAGADLVPPGILVLPSKDPAFARVEYDPATGRLDIVLISGRVCEFEGVPLHIVEQLQEVEDHAAWFLRVLLAEYPLVRMGVTP